MMIRKNIDGFVLILGFFFLVLRAPYGFSFNDEPFIITLGQRLSYGDALLVEEWHLTQLFSPVIMIFYKLFHLFSDSNEGIILTFRYIYACLWFLVCYIVYRELKKQYAYSIFVFIYLILFAPFDYMSISYKSVGVMCILSIACILLSCITKRLLPNLCITMIIAVLSFVCALCCPYMLLFLMLLYLYYLHLYSKTNNFRNENDHVFLIITCIVLCFGCLYLYFFSLKKFDFTMVFASIHFLFEDPEHYSSFVGLIKNIEKVLLAFTKECQVNTVILIVSFIFSYKCKREYRKHIFLLACLGYIIAQLQYITRNVYGTFNNEVINIAMLGIIAFMLLDHKPWPVFSSFSVLGFSYIIADTMLSSNTGLHEFGVNIVIVGVGSIIFIVELFKELNLSFFRMRKFFTIACSILFIIQLSTQLYTRIYRQYWDLSVPEMTSTIEVGANKGIRTTPKQKEKYTYHYQNLKKLLLNAQADKQSRFLSLSRDPVCYLDADMKFGTFSAWTFGYKKDELGKRLDNYYSILPENSPDYIFAKSEKDIISNMSFEGYERYDYNGSILFKKLSK